MANDVCLAEQEVLCGNACHMDFMVPYTKIYVKKILDFCDLMMYYIKAV